MSLIQVHSTLIEKHDIMFSFVDKYLFEKANVRRNNMLEPQGNFINVIQFCINQRQQPVNTHRENAINYTGVCTSLQSSN